MKRAIKTTIAMLLAITIACGSMVAFAAAPADIQWRMYDDSELVSYAYAGELAVGGETEIISAKEDNSNVYFTFEAEEDGYYKISSDSCSFEDGWFGIPEKCEDGVYYDVKNNVAGNDFTDRYFYLEKGEHIVCVSFDWLSEDNFRVDFAGEIVDIECGYEGTKEFILGYHLSEEYDENGEMFYYYGTSVEIEFSSGEKFMIDYADVCFYTDKKLEHGENEVEISLYGTDYREKGTIEVIDVAKVVAKVEMTNIENYTTVKYYYRGGIDYNSVENETVTVTYTDGTTEVIEGFCGYAELDRHGIPIDCYHGIDKDGDYVLCVSAADIPFITEKCDFEFASTLENIGRYHEFNRYDIEDRFIMIGVYFRDIFYSDSVDEAIESFRYFFEECTSGWLYTFAAIMRNTAKLISYIA